MCVWDGIIICTVQVYTSITASKSSEADKWYGIFPTATCVAMAARAWDTSPPERGVWVGDRV